MKNNKKIYILIVSVLTILVLIFMNRKYITSLFNVSFSTKGNPTDSDSNTTDYENKYICDKNTQKDSLDIINNGNNYVKLGNYTYYREYTKDSLEETGLHHSYGYRGNSVQKIVRINEHGEKEELFEDKGVGEIFILGDRMYLSECNPENYEQSLYSIDFRGQNRKNYGKGNFNYVDEKIIK